MQRRKINSSPNIIFPHNVAYTTPNNTANCFPYPNSLEAAITLSIHGSNTDTHIFPYIFAVAVSVNGSYSKSHVFPYIFTLAVPVNGSNTEPYLVSIPFTLRFFNLCSRHINTNFSPYITHISD